MAGNVGQLGRDRAFRHHHVARNAAGARRQRQRGAVVAGRMGNHAGTGAIGIQRPHRVAGAAEFECAAALQVLGLEGQLRAGQRIERARAQHRGHAGVRRDPRSGSQDIVGTGQQ